MAYAQLIIAAFLVFAGIGSCELGLQRPQAARSLLGARDHKFKQGDDITLYANKVVPLSNPSETYQYYTLPFCTPAEGKNYRIEDLGEVLEGDRLVTTPYKLKFRADVDNAVLCKKTLTAKDLAKFRDAVKQDYYMQLFFDDLPIWGFIGKNERFRKPEKQFVYTHFHFDIAYNEDRVIQVNLSVAHPNAKKALDVTEGENVEVEFSYSANWVPTSIPFDHRMDRYLHDSFLPQHLEIHWFSIINSCVTVLLLTGFLATILLRVLKNDFLKYSRDDEMGEEQEESGWKYLHGDVFRFPKHVNLFSAMMGVGTQMLCIVFFILILALIGIFYPHNRGRLLAACVVLYALSAGLAGYTAGSFYKMLGGTHWVSNVLLTASLFCGPLLVMFSFLNTVAIIYRSTAALPFGTIVIIILLWALVTFPLTVLGAINAKNSKADFNAPCRTTKFPRDVPPLPWYRTTFPQMVMAGFLPFSAIYIELSYIFTTVWGTKHYTIYSILFIVFIILLIVTAFITVALTYFQLAVEDHRWWWRSFFCGGSTGLFIFGYCFYYYIRKSGMSGLMQTSFFFGYNALVCYAFFLMLGAIGFRASLLFVRHIYRAIKCE